MTDKLTIRSCKGYERLISSLRIAKCFQQSCGENEVGSHTHNSRGRSSSTIYRHPVPVISGLDTRGIGRFGSRYSGYGQIRVSILGVLADTQYSFQLQWVLSAFQPDTRRYRYCQLQVLQVLLVAFGSGEGEREGCG